MSGFELISEKELSRETSVSINTLRWWRAQGEGPPYHKLGRSIRYRRQDVEQWLEATKVTPEKSH